VGKVYYVQVKIWEAMAWNCLPTCIGSLPHSDPKEAVDLILRQNGLVPFWPQLPARGFNENMYAQYSTHLPGIRMDVVKKRISVDLRDYDPERFYTSVISENVNDFSYPEDSFSGFYEFVSRDIPAWVKALKGQVTGPISTGLQIFDTDGRPAIYDEAYGEIIRKNLNMMARWQESILRSKCSNTIMFIDEPSLSLLGTPFASISWDDATKWIDEVLSGLKSWKAIHCCGNTDWPRLMTTDIDILSFDAYNYAYTIALYPDEVERFMRSGGSLAWGIVPNNEDEMRDETVSSLIGRADSSFEMLIEKGVDKEVLLRNSIITPECGLGGVDEPLSARILETLVAVSRGLKEKHGLESDP
jgi:methionine synthase II (cobalamin-independent)